VETIFGGNYQIPVETIMILWKLFGGNYFRWKLSN